MERVWFIEIKKRQEGPFSVWELCRDPRLTPDTLVWKEGMARWLPIRKVPELDALLFGKDHAKPKELHDDDPLLGISPRKNEPSEEMILNLDFDPSPLFWFLLIAVLICLFLIIRSTL